MSGWIAGATIGAGVLGAGVSYLGASQASKAQDRATQANKESKAESDRIGWTNYLLSRGIQPIGYVEPGQMPAEYKAVNARLPAWANVKRSAPTFRRRVAPVTADQPFYPYAPQPTIPVERRTLPNGQVMS